MGIHLELVDHDDRFHRGLSREPLIVNDYDVSSARDLDQLNDLLFTTYSGDLLSNLASCECKKTVGNSNKGAICPHCETEVKPQVDEYLEPTVWLRGPRLPNGQYMRLVNLQVWALLDKIFTRSDFSFLQWLTNPRYDPFKKPLNYLVKVEEVMREQGLQRGYNNFINNFDALFDILVQHVGMKEKNKREEVQELVALIQENRNIIFPQHLPLPNKSMFVVEESNMGPFVDYTILGALDAIRTVVGIDSPSNDFATHVKEGRIARVLALLAEYQTKQYRELLAPKEGVFRKQRFGTRCHFTFRAVVSSITGPHNYLDCEIPWSVGLVVFQPMLLGKLYRLGYNPLTAKRFLDEHARRYNPLLDQLLQEIVQSTKYDGYPFTLQRNPSLERGSMQVLFIKRVKTDISDPTISMSILIVRGYNADFDGDELNGMLLMDEYTADRMMGMLPHKSAFDFEAPRQLSKNLSLSKPSVSTYYSWMSSKPLEADPVKLGLMAEFQ